MGNNVTKITFSAAALLLLVGGILLYKEQSQHFPALLPGFYAGTISGLEESGIPVLLKVDNDSIHLLETSHDSNEITVHMQPPIFSLHGQEVRLFGDQDKDGEYSGTIQNRLSATIGRWTLVKLGTATDQLGRSQQWLSVATQLDAARLEKESVEGELARTDEEIARLKTISFDEAGITASAHTKEKEDREALATAQNEAQEVSKQVELLHRQLELIQKLSPMGHMVQLSREVFMKEQLLFAKALGERLPEEDGE